jgi:DNA-binding transcriptional LysR family regulator
MPKAIAHTIEENRISRRLRFRDLQVFFAVVQCGSMAKAAIELGVTQPAVSAVIAELESTFGVRLFDRSPQGVVPTIYGRALHKRGIAALEELKQGIRDIEFLANPNTGEVRIGCPESITFLPPMVQRFCQDYPGIALTVEPVPTPTLELPDLYARKLDFVLARVPGAQASAHFGDELNIEILFDDEAIIAAGANSRWARLRRIDFEDLVDAPWVGTSRETFPTILLEEAFRARNLPMPRMRVTTFSVQLRTHLLATGHFLTAMPKSMLHLSANSIKLKRLPVEFPNAGFHVAIVTLRNRTLSPPVELFIKALRTHVKLLA